MGDFHRAAADSWLHSGVEHAVRRSFIHTLGAKGTARSFRGTSFMIMSVVLISASVPDGDRTETN